MIKLVLTTILVFIFNIVLSNIFDKFYIILPLILLVNFFHYFNNSKYYLIYAFIVGLVYEIVFLNTIIVYGLFFLTIGTIISYLYKNLENNALANIGVFILVLNIFVIAEYLGLIVVNYTIFNIKYFVFILLRTNIINITLFLLTTIKIKKTAKNKHKYAHIT